MKITKYVIQVAFLISIFSLSSIAVCQEHLSNAPAEEMTGAYVFAENFNYEYMDILTEIGNTPTRIACPFKTIDKYGFNYGDYVYIKYRKRPIREIFPAATNNDMVNYCIDGKVLGVFKYGLFEAESKEYKAKLHIRESGNSLFDRFTLAIMRKSDRNISKIEGECRRYETVISFYKESRDSSKRPYFEMRNVFGGLSVEDNAEFDVMKSIKGAIFNYVPFHEEDSTIGTPVRKDEWQVIANYLDDVYEIYKEMVFPGNCIDLSDNNNSISELLSLCAYYVLFNDPNIENTSHDKELTFGSNYTTDYYAIIPIRKVVQKAKRLFGIEVDINNLPDLSNWSILVQGDNFAVNPHDGDYAVNFYVTDVVRDKNGLLHVSLEDVFADYEGKREQYSAVLKDKIVNGRRNYTIVKMK